MYQPLQQQVRSMHQTPYFPLTQRSRSYYCLVPTAVSRPALPSRCSSFTLHTPSPLPASSPTNPDSVKKMVQHSTQVMQMGMDWIKELTQANDSSVRHVSDETGKTGQNDTRNIEPFQLHAARAITSPSGAATTQSPQSHMSDANLLKASSTANSLSSSCQTIQLKDKKPTDLPPVLMDVEIFSSAANTDPISSLMRYYSNGHHRVDDSAAAVVAAPEPKIPSSLANGRLNCACRPMVEQTITAIEPNKMNPISSLHPVVASKKLPTSTTQSHPPADSHHSESESTSTVSIPHCLACIKPATMQLPSIPTSAPIINLSIPSRGLSQSETAQLCAILSDHSRMDSQSDALLRQVKQFEEKQFQAYVHKHQQDALAAAANRKLNKKKRTVPPVPLFTESTVKADEEKNANSSESDATPFNPTIDLSTSSISDGVNQPAKKKQKTISKKKVAKQPSAPPSIEAIKRRAKAASTSATTVNLNKYQCLWVDPRTTRRCQIECSDYAARLDHIRIIHRASGRTHMYHWRFGDCTIFLSSLADCILLLLCSHVSYPCRKTPCRFIASTEAEYSSHVCVPIIPLNKQMTKSSSMKSTTLPAPALPPPVVPPVIPTLMDLCNSIPQLQPIGENTKDGRPI